MTGSTGARRLALVHAAYWIITGVWPLLHRRSFEAVTGPKEDYWLVETVGVLLATLGIVLLCAGINERITPEIMLLGFGGCAVLIAITTYYVAVQRIRVTYLIDLIVELALAITWLRHRRPADVARD